MLGMHWQYFSNNMSFGGDACEIRTSSRHLLCCMVQLIDKEGHVGNQKMEMQTSSFVPFGAVRREITRKTPFPKSLCYIIRMGQASIVLIFNCILFSFLASFIIIFVAQPHETQQFLHEKLVPPIQTFRRAVIKALRPKPVIYHLHIPLHCISQSLDPILVDKETYECKTHPILSDEIKQAFQRDGVVALRGLISPQLLSDLDTASKVLIAKERDRIKRKGLEYSSGKQFKTKKMSPIFDLEQELSGFRKLALASILPQVAAELMGFDTPSNNETKIRVLRDVFLAKDEGQYFCGWHVDDWGFWPASASSDGVNVWIAIDDMPALTGGGFAVSVGSHRAPWRHEAYEVIGATPTIPLEGFRSAEDMFQNRKGSGTCNLKNAAPLLNEIMEDNRRVYDVKAGDVIIHTRWLFHRTVPFHQHIVRDYYRKLEDPSTSMTDMDPLLYRRYTIRYAPGHATLPKGYVTELSILWDGDNAGRTLDDVSSLDAPWYPQAYPTVNSYEMVQMRDLVDTKLPVAEARRKERFKEMQPFLHEVSLKQREMLRMNSHGLHGRTNGGPHDEF